MQEILKEFEQRNMQDKGDTRVIHAGLLQKKMDYFLSD